MSFGPFRLDPANRRLSRDGAPVELNARYLDALILLVAADGELVTKERFMEEVWRGIPVTDEALTQAIRTLRRTLPPRTFETVHSASKPTNNLGVETLRSRKHAFRL